MLFSISGMAIAALDIQQPWPPLEGLSAGTKDRERGESVVGRKKW